MTDREQLIEEMTRNMRPVIEQAADQVLAVRESQKSLTVPCEDGEVTAGR